MISGAGRARQDRRLSLLGAPASIPGALAAHMQSAGERGRIAATAGAVGTVAIQNPKNIDIPWERSSLARFMPAMSLADPALDESGACRSPSASTRRKPRSCSPARGTRFAEILEAADAGKPLPHFAIPNAQGDRRRQAGRRRSQNVVAVLPGNDPS